MPVRRKKAVERVETPVLTSFYLKLVGAGFVIAVAAFFIGRSDTGPINVASTIQSANQEMIDAGGNPIDSVATAPESLRNLPNGGLVPADPNAAPTPAPEPTPEDPASTTPEGGGEREVSAENTDRPEGEGEPAEVEGADSAPAN